MCPEQANPSFHFFPWGETTYNFISLFVKLLFCEAVAIAQGRNTVFIVPRTEFVRQMTNALERSVAPWSLRYTSLWPLHIIAGCSRHSGVNLWHRFLQPACSSVPYFPFVPRRRGSPAGLLVGGRPRGHPAHFEGKIRVRESFFWIAAPWRWGNVEHELRLLY